VFFGGFSDELSRKGAIWTYAKGGGRTNSQKKFGEARGLS